MTTVTYQLGKTIRKKILFHSDKGAFFCLSTYQCDCTDSSFSYPHHKHINTGDIREIENNKLRKLLSTNYPNCREPQTIKCSDTFTKTTTALDTCTEAMTPKT